MSTIQSTMVRAIGLPAALVMLLLAAMSGANAQYPSRPIRLMIMTQPGGAPDIIGRLLATRFTERFGQPVVVENRAGSNGNLAGEAVAKAPADGYTLLMAHDALFSISPHIYPQMGFDPNRDLVPVASIAIQDFVFAVNPSLPVKSLAEFIEFARKARPPLAYASAGSGTQQHLAMELFKSRSGLDMTHVPYKGGAGAATAMVAGDTLVTIGGSTLEPQIRAGRLRALATTGPDRAENYPGLPAVAETYPGYAVSVWIGLFAPTGTPADTITRLRGEIERFLADSTSRQRLYSGGGMVPHMLAPDALAASMRRDFDTYGKLIRSIDLKAD